MPGLALRDCRAAIAALLARPGGVSRRGRNASEHRGPRQAYRGAR